jgi:hypothetical protein
MKRALFALSLIACNQVFGIEDTTPPAPSDFDHDGIGDDHDDCPTAANADQADTDHDGFGDACDPCVMGPQSGSDGDRDGIDDACDVCLTGPNHEEDGDGALDGCDVCPGIADPAQTDADGDGLGDACDPEVAEVPSTQHRIFFDSFDPPVDGWQFGFESWVAAGGALVPQAEPLEAYHGPWNPRAMVDGTDWLVETEVDLPTAPQTGDVVGLFMYRPDGSSVLACSLLWNGAVWIVAGTGTTVQPARTVVIASHAYPSSAGSDVFCMIAGAPALQIGAVTTQPWYPAITGVPGAQFHWLDVAR